MAVTFAERVHLSGGVSDWIPCAGKMFPRVGHASYCLRTCPRARAEVLHHRSFKLPLRPSFEKIISQEIITFEINSKLELKNLQPRHHDVCLIQT